MQVTQRPVLRPIRGRDFDFQTFSDVITSNVTLDDIAANIASIDLGSLLQDRMIVLEMFMTVFDSMSEGPIGPDMQLLQSGTAVLEFIRAGAFPIEASTTMVVGGFVTLNLTTIARVTTAGTKVLNMNARIGQVAPTNVLALANFTGISAWVI